MNQSTILQFSIIATALSLFLSLNGCQSGPDLPSLLEVIEGDPDYSEYLALSNASGRTADLDGNFVYTLMVPSNSALQNYKSQLGISDWSELSDSTLGRIIWYHRQIGKIFSNDFQSGYYASPCASYLGEAISILFEVSGSSVVLNDSIKMISGNIDATDGVVHQLDAVMPIPNIYDILKTNGNFTIYLEAMEKAGLTERLKTEVGMTVFASPDEVWETYFDNEPGVENLDDFSVLEMEDFMLYHIMPDFRTSRDFNNLSFPEEFSTELAGEQVRIYNNGITGVVINDSINAFLMDIHGINGALHFLDDVLEVSE